MDIYSEVRLLSHMIVLFLILEEDFHIFPKIMYKDSNFSTSSPKFIVFFFLLLFLIVQERPCGAITHPRSGAAAQRSYPTSKERRLHGCRRAERSYSTFRVRGCGHEEIPLVQCKEQLLHFARAAVKRYPTFKVRET